jgi:hypothetical protein
MRQAPIEAPISSTCGRVRLQPLAVEQPVQGQQREPLRAPGRGRDAGDVGGLEAVLAHVREGARTGPERHQRVGAHGGYDPASDEVIPLMTKILLLLIVVLIAYVLYLRTNRRR